MLYLTVPTFVSFLKSFTLLGIAIHPNRSTDHDLLAFPPPRIPTWACRCTSPVKLYTQDDHMLMTSHPEERKTTEELLEG
jgi:hypothetical protein